MGGKSEANYTYWKRPWHKWIILAAALIQLLCLWMRIQEYGLISRTGISGTPEWADYTAQVNWQCALNGLMAVCLLGYFLIGVFARTKKEAGFAGGLLLLLLALAWGAAGFGLHLLSSASRMFLWSLLLLTAIAGAARGLSCIYHNHNGW